MDLPWKGVDATTDAALKADRTKGNCIINNRLTVGLDADTSRPILSTYDGDETSTSR
jgi:hypothetical protein